MERIDDLRKLMDDYIVFSLEQRKKTSGLNSLFSHRAEELGHPGHGEFDEKVEQWANDLAASRPSQEVLTAGLELLLFGAGEQEGEAPYWYLTAIQRHALVLLPLLDDDHRKQLVNRFTEEYPPRQQVPVQTQIHKMLDPGAKSGKFKLFGRK